MIKFITDTLPGEIPFDASEFQHDLRITDLDGVEISTFAVPRTGWTHEKLEKLAIDIDNNDRFEKVHEGADAYLGEQWVGSTEV